MIDARARPDERLADGTLLQGARSGGAFAAARGAGLLLHPLTAALPTPHTSCPGQRPTRDAFRLTVRPRRVPALRVDAPATPLTGLRAAAKRAFDIGVALPLLALAAVPMLAIALLIQLDSPGPPLFCQHRIGRFGRQFVLLKFRTMHLSACRERCRQARRDDPRITRFGAWLRRTSLDELPQLLNVLRGDMSLVGPRPHAPGTRAGDRLFEEVTHRYAARHMVRPGMTGLAQIRGWRGETDTEEKLLLRLASDLEYIEGWSFARDLRIIWRTIFSVLCMRNAY
ncbi:MAG: sugar transferase [Acetobacteraceae bacterium]